MTEEMEWPDRRDRPGLRVPMAKRDRTARPDGTAGADRPVRLGVLEIRDETGRTVFRDETEWRAWLALRDRPGPLVRRVNAVRRVSRALRAILVRLASRAYL